MKRIKLAVLMCLLIGIFVGIDIYEYNTYADSFIEIAGMEELINIAVSRDTATPEEIANAKVLTYKEDATTVYEFLVDCVITHNLSIDTGETVKFKGCKDVNFEYDDNTKIAAYDGIKLYGKFSANRFFTVTNSSIVYVEDLIFDGTNAQSFIWSTHYNEYFVNSAATLNFDDCLFTNFKLRTDVYFSTIIRSVSSATTNINNCNFYSNEVDDIMYASIIEFQGTKNNTLQNTNFYKCKAAFGIETYRKSTSNNIKVVDCELRLVYYIKASSQYSCTISNLEVYNSVLNEVLDSNENTTMTNINIHDNQIEAVLFSTWQYTTTSQRTLTLKNVIAKKNNNNNFISVCYGNAVLDGIIDTDSNRMDVGYNGDETITFKNDVNIVNYPVSLNVLKDVPGAIRIIYEDETELDINNFNCIDEVYNDNVFGVRKEVVNNKGVLKQTRKFTEDLVGDDISNLWYDGTSLEFSTQILNRDIILELNEYYAQWKEGYYDTEANGYAYKSNDKRASISEFISVIGGTDFEICCNDVENILFGIVEFDENGNVIKRTESLKGGDVLTLQSLTCNVSMFIYNQADNLYDGTGSDDKEIEKVALWARMQFRKDLLVSVKFTTGALNPWGNYLGKAKITGYKDNIYAGPAKILFEAENEYILGELERQFYIVCDINDDIEARILKIQGGTNEYLMYSGGRVLDNDDFVLGQEFESSGVKKISVDCGEVDIENEDYFCGEKTLILEEKIIYISQSNTNNGKTNVEIIDMPEKVHVDVQDIYDNVIGESIIEVNIDEMKVYHKLKGDGSVGDPTP